MKNRKLFGTMIILALSGISGSALAFPVPASTFVSPQVVQATICNPEAVPMECRLVNYGVLQTGNWLNAWEDWVLQPGGCETAYVYANYPYYFVDGTFEDDCFYD
jgi:hypothetical protein